ncbi:MAG TPA: DoxX family protein [Dehalococcoidia bacterium]|nr:DoxX family protein [Dehalococcoidia bacterium]
MATRARPIPHKELTGWPAWVRRTHVDRVWLDALPESLAQSVMGPFTLLLRLTMGWIFLWSGIDKLVTNFSASGFLANATQGPLGGWFQDLGANQAALDIINPLVIWGQILIGATLVLGLFTRAGLFWAAAMMMLFYLAQFPPANNPFMDEHLVYVLLFGVLGALGAGRILGLDAWVERMPWVKRNRLVALLLG